MHEEGLDFYGQGKHDFIISLFTHTIYYGCGHIFPSKSDLIISPPLSFRNFLHSHFLIL